MTCLNSAAATLNRLEADWYSVDVRHLDRGPLQSHIAACPECREKFNKIKAAHERFLEKNRIAAAKKEARCAAPCQPYAPPTDTEDDVLEVVHEAPAEATA